MSNPRVRLVVLLMLTWLSTWYVTDRLIVPNVRERIAFEQLSLAGQNEPPYRYRLFAPVVNGVVQSTLLSGIAIPEVRHVASYFLFSLVTFALLYDLLYRYLRQFFTPKTALTGLLLFQIAVPLAVTGFYMEEDFVTLIIYLLALNLMLSKHDRWLPVVMLVGAFVREQTIFILLLYIIYHYTNQTLRREIIVILGVSALIYGMIYIGLRATLGVVPTTYTVSYHISENLNPDRLFLKSLPLWLAEIFGFVALALMAYRRSTRFFQLAFVSLLLYVILFFFNGVFNELGKFLPAHLILIPMGLQVLLGEYIGTDSAAKAN